MQFSLIDLACVSSSDHIYTDAALAKINLRWRTALIIRELEQEILALAAGREQRSLLKELMSKKEVALPPE